MPMTVDSAKRKLGIIGDADLARFFNVTRSAINNWRLRHIPPGRVAEVRVYLATGSKPERRERRKSQ